MKKNVKDRETELTSEERYLLYLNEFSSTYLLLVTASGITYAAAIAIAVISNVLIGIALAIFTAIIYFYFSTEEPKRYLGLSCKNIAGRIHVTKIAPSYGDTVYVPSRLMWADVTSLDDGALSANEETPLAALYLPRSIEHIGKELFGNNETRPVIYYEGSIEEWEKINTETDLTEITVVPHTPLPTFKNKQKRPDTAEKDTEVQE